MANKIPKLFHFVFGLKEQTEPFHLAYYLCLKSCIEVNKPSAIHFYYYNEPYGEYWALIKPHLQLIKIEPESFIQDNEAYQNHQEGQYIKAANLDYAHQTDFIRLKKLIEHGGVYADMDTLFVQPIPDELYRHSFVIGREQNVTDSLTKETVPSLCNALLMAEPNSAFAQKWLQASYQSFDGTWSSHSCQQAATLASAYPEEVYVAPQRFFFKHMWTQEGISTLFEGLDADFDQVFSMHMWNHLWWDESRVDFSEFHSALLNESNIRSTDTTYNIIARPYLPQADRAKGHETTTMPSTDSDLLATESKPSVAILIPKIAEDWKFGTGENEGLFYHKGSEQCFATNEVTNLILEQCDGVQSVEAIIGMLTLDFPDSAEDISRDVQEILRQLALSGAIEFKQTANTVRPMCSLPDVPPKQYKLCIGMATYDDYDGVYFSIQAIRLYHPEVLEDIEFVVLDNNPTGACADALKSLGDSMSNYRYIQGDNFQGTWSRFSLINNTSAPYVLCMDSHVMIESGAIKRLLEYFDSHPDTPDFLQGPLMGDDLASLSSHFTPGWGAGMYGTWARDSRADDIDGEPFDIPMQGLGLFALRRDNWPQVNPRFKGFGGEEGYVHEKMRRAGGRTLCLPFLRWMHRFNRPMGARYALSWDDRIRNYMIAHKELGISNHDMVAHFESLIGEKETLGIVTKVESEIANPFYLLDAIFCISQDSDPLRWAAVEQQLQRFGVSHRLRRFPVFETPNNIQVGRALAHRTIIQLAELNQYDNVLILEEDVSFDVSTIDSLSKSLAEAKSAKWDILYLGGVDSSELARPLSGSVHLREINNEQSTPVSTRALIYNASVYSKCLDDLPDNIEEMEGAVERQFSTIDHYLAVNDSIRKIVVEPNVTS